MSEAQVVAARTLIPLVGVQNATILIAISFLESAGEAAAAGDCVGTVGYHPGGAACRGCQSWGLFQVNLPAWGPYLQSVTGSNTPCDWAAWLSDPTNSARAAAHVLQTQGLGAWRSDLGRYQQYLPQAAAIVAAAAGENTGQQVAGTVTAEIRGTGAVSPDWAVALAAGVGLVGLVLIVRGMRRM